MLTQLWIWPEFGTPAWCQWGEMNLSYIILVSISNYVKRAYYGMVHERRPHGRWEEHWRATLQHSAHIASETELNYEYMARHGGAAGWFFLV